MTNNGPPLVAIDIESSPIVLSPMTNLTLNLGSTSLSVTPQIRIHGRRLSMSSLTPDTPVSSTLTPDHLNGKSGTPSRLSRNVARMGSRSGLMRRLNSAPLASTTTPDGVSPGQESNKENTSRILLSPIKRESVLTAPVRARTPFDNHDTNSQDSGYMADETHPGFRFTEPSGFAPRKSSIEPSPKKRVNEDSNSPSKTISSPRADERMKSVSFYSSESFDDGFLELGDLDKSFTDENSELPAGLNSLLTGTLISLNDTLPVEEEMPLSRPPPRRANSLVESYTSPASSKARVGLFRDEFLSPQDLTPVDKVPFKRPREVENSSAKRRKSNSLQIISENTQTESPIPRYKLQRSISETAASSLSSVLHQNDLIADFTRPYALPMVSGRHEDLKSITPETLARLMNGHYKNVISSYKIIDCRYPYEYEGGHIKGSVNLYTREQVQKELFSNVVPIDDISKDSLSEKRHILVFHCEFSVERGPALYRFLRRCDRSVSSYPSLQYPEVYLLHGGYESFFDSQKCLCEPCSYQPMVDPKHENDLKKFRVKSNSWSGDVKRPQARTSLKRLGLF